MGRGLAFGLAVIWIPLLFPDGHLPGPRWRPFAWVAAVTVGAVTIAAAIAPDAQSGYSGKLLNPVGVGGPVGALAAAVNAVGLPLAAVLCLVALGSLVVRFRRARGVERQQLKWFLFAAGFLFAAILVTLATQAQAAWYALELGMAALPVAAGLAVLRYRLYEIDRIISRTVSYGFVTAILVAAYAGAILLLQGPLGTVTGGDTISVAISTLLVAALFQPVRRRIQLLVDRRFDRARFDAARTSSEFSERLRDEVDITAVTTDLDLTVRGAFRPTALGLWLRDAGSR